MILTESNKLCEFLKTLLEQKQLTTLEGDYRSGKKLNMKKIISFIASNYRKDKIWLRRSSPENENFKIMLALDDSSSMSHKNAGKLAIFSLSILS